MEALLGCPCLLFWLVVFAVVLLVVVKAFGVNKNAEETILERWTAMLSEHGHKAADYLPKVEQAMKARNLPYGYHREKIATSLSSTEYHEFVSCPMNADYTAFFGYVVQGNDLSVNWLLQDHMIKGVYRLPVIGPLLLSVMKRYTFAMGNKVRAFAGATHACAVEAAEQILEEANGDKSKLNRKTSGKLGPL